MGLGNIQNFLIITKCFLGVIEVNNFWSMNILIIDKFPVFRMGLTVFFKENFSKVRVFEVSDHSSITLKLLPMPISLVVLGINGHARQSYQDAIVELRRRHPVAKIIIYDEHAELILGLSYLRLGSDAYVSKRAALLELNLCVQNLLAGKKFVSKEVFNLASICDN